MQSIMKRLVLLTLIVSFCAWLHADNFVLLHGQSSKVYVQHSESGSVIERADGLFSADYHEVFGGDLVHTPHIEDARIIAATYDSPTLRKYARLRGISFESLAHQHEAFILKVHNNGSQLFVVGSDARGLAYGLMTLSRQWGVSPFRWWVDAPALPLDRYELDVIYEQLFRASVDRRILVLDGAQRQDRYIQELLLRLRATDVVSSHEAAAVASDDHVFVWNLSPAIQPYLGLSLALDHPERIRIEALNAYDHGCVHEWQLHLGHQMGGELQTFLFFDMAWNVPAYRDAYALDQFVDLHYTQMSGQQGSWSQLWNDYFDLAMNFHPEQVMSVESLRRGIGESQSLALQLSLELNNKVIAQEYNHSFFRTLEYPVNMLTSQIQRLCNLQLLRHGMGTNWSVEDCTQRMSLLARSLPELVTPKWRQMLGATLPPVPDMESSLMCRTAQGLADLAVGSDAPLQPEDTDVLLYRSDRATGTPIRPYKVLQIPLNHKAGRLHLLVSMLPVRDYGKPIHCIVTVDNGEPYLLTIDQAQLSQDRQLWDLYFDIDPDIESHKIAFRTSTNGIFLQRVWLKDIE